MDQLYSTLFEAVTFLQNGRHIDCENSLIDIQKTLASAPCCCHSNLCRNFLARSMDDINHNFKKEVSAVVRSEGTLDLQTNICHNCAIKETIHVELDKYMKICHAVRAREELIEADKLAAKFRYSQVFHFFSCQALINHHDYAMINQIMCSLLYLCGWMSFSRRLQCIKRSKLSIYHPVKCIRLLYHSINQLLLYCNNYSTATIHLYQH